MKTLYEKNELTFALVWIAIYCVLQSFANPLNQIIGIEYAASAVFCVLQAVVLFSFIRKNKLQKRYGLCRSPLPAGRFLYYVPLLILASGNLWNGVAFHYTPAETVCRVVCMLCVGFLEEVIFRGFLFVTIFSLSGSLLPCSLAHSAINTLGTFANDAELTIERQLLHIAVLTLITIGYTLILTRTLPKDQWGKRN